MKKVKVTFIESIAGLADPKPQAELDVKYEAKRASMKANPRPLSDKAIAEVIENIKKHDRYYERPVGFTRDYSYKPGDVALVDAELAAKWEAGGVCQIVPEQTGKAA